jgi:hypothetical protein
VLAAHVFPAPGKPAMTELTLVTERGEQTVAVTGDYTLRDSHPRLGVLVSTSDPGPAVHELYGGSAPLVRSSAVTQRREEGGHDAFRMLIGFADRARRLGSIHGNQSTVRPARSLYRVQAVGWLQVTRGAPSGSQRRSGGSGTPWSHRST